MSDGANTYVYDSANRLVSVNSTETYTYNGLGDRLTQNGTQYVLDLNAGLTQVLSDGENSYVYGLGRISQTNTTTEYFLGDALGSVRQLSMTDGEIPLAQSYDPYGVVTYAAGTSSTPYGFTGETTDANGLVYLRARYYSSGAGRFLSRDTWGGDYNRPLSLNRWMYVEGNPVNYVDPSGHITEKESQQADKYVKELKIYNLYVKVDWGLVYNRTIAPPLHGIRSINCAWEDGYWTLDELKELRKGAFDLSRAMGGLNKFNAKLGHVNVSQVKLTGSNAAAAAEGDAHSLKVNAIYQNKFRRWAAVHELSHVWDGNNNWELSRYLESYTGGYTLSPSSVDTPAYCQIDIEHEMPGCNDAGYFYGGVPPKTSGGSFDRYEDFAESVTAYVYPSEARAVVGSQLAKYEKLYKSKNPDLYQIYYSLLSYDDYRATERGQFVEMLFRTWR